MKLKKILAGEDTHKLSLLKSGMLLCAFVLIFAIMISAVVAGANYLEEIEYNSGTYVVKGSGNCGGEYCFFGFGSCPSRCRSIVSGYAPPRCCCPYPNTIMAIYKPSGVLDSSKTCAPDDACSLTNDDCSEDGQYYAIWDRRHGKSGTCPSTTCDGANCDALYRNMSINTRNVNWDGNEKDCTCLSISEGGEGGACFSEDHICWTGSKCCGDDSGESYEDSAACCFNGYALPNGYAGDGSPINNDLFCYNGEFYSCNQEYDFATHNVADCYQIGGYYCAPHPVNRWKQGTGEDVPCDDCMECGDGECKSSCEPCQECLAGERCEWRACGSSDSSCGIDGVIDCSGWYHLSGRENPNELQYCWNYADITSGQCEGGWRCGGEGCKDSNTYDCNTWSYLNDDTVYECGECKYIEDGDCYETNLGSCTNWPVDTPCQVEDPVYEILYGKCDGAGICDTWTECGDGTAVGSCSPNHPKYCYPGSGELYDDCAKCGCCPEEEEVCELDCEVSGHCTDPSIDCSIYDGQSACSANFPTCFWNSINLSCFSCSGRTCASYTGEGKEICEADMCEVTGAGASSNCSWDDDPDIGCYENIFIEDCFNGVDDDGDGDIDCGDSGCSSSGYCQGTVSCGDGVVNPGEECDGDFASQEYTFLNGAGNCIDFGFDGGALACNPSGVGGQCNLNFSGCTGGVLGECGNNTRESRESCDGSDLGGKTCFDLGFFSGDLDCNSCHFNTWGCDGAVTKEGNAAACEDDDDNDNDDYTDYMDEDCQDRDKSPNPVITRSGGACESGEKKAIASLEYTYYLRFGLEDKTITKDVEVTCPIPLAARLPFFSLLSFLITAVLLFVYYLLREKKAIKY